MPVEEHWDTLTSTPLYVTPNGSLVVGFVGSKQGAETGKWHTFGDATGTSDNREGWWCATDFVLRYHAIDDPDGIEAVRESTSLGEPNPIRYYDLSGRRILPHASDFPKGIYIKVEKGRSSLMSR